MAKLRLKRWVPRPVKEQISAALQREIARNPPPPPPPPEVVVVPAPPTSPLTAADALRLPYLAAAAVVSEPDADDLAFPPFAPRADLTEDLALPPNERWTVAEQFLESGQRDATQMLESLAGSGFRLQAGTRVLDFGCGPGRVLRWLPSDVDGWGVDLDAERIAWCQQALSPPFRFATCGTYPHLPFADDTFELIYAGSVFTHLAELADAWLLELLRITAPGGLLYLTIHDRESVDFCREKDPEAPSRALTGHAWPEETEARFAAWGDRLGVDLEGFTIGRGYLAQVFYDRDALVRHWGRYAEVVEVFPRAFAVHQTAVLLRCPPAPRSRRRRR